MIRVVVPEFEDHYVISKKRRAVYWKVADIQKGIVPKRILDNYHFTINGIMCDHEDKPALRNTKTAGKPRKWMVNGQDLYNGTLHHTLRAKVTEYFHEYLEKYINEQISGQDKTLINQGFQVDARMSISLDIYEIKRAKMPDIGNLWLWIKWFEDALQTAGVIPDDNPDYVIESGRKRYIWVGEEHNRKLVFKINFI